ncbi:type IV conjugative transfer system protein TraV [Legionella busanensis]|uniref:Type IV conjugative transfer system protein TraV n=1 Tax=Legionella busanensis TaxID=190655 RepID=A0A378K8I6_9GAMM|nr:hypothetical protein [Legionella busanensis]STX81258.1 type IV conjugative transfer system protein TraV [Legionella busanensis]
MKSYQFYIPFILLSLLSGCGKTIFDQDARCPFVERGGCQSMEIVNKMVTERQFTRDGLFVQQACLDCERVVLKDQHSSFRQSVYK